MVYVMLAVVLVFVAAFALQATQGSGEDGASQTGPRTTNASQVKQVTHVHGLATPPWAPGELFVSTHEGLVHVDAQGNWRYASETRHDFMGFQDNPTQKGVLYSSGHPAPGSGLTNPIGFMVSRDSGATWQTLALQGKADFHAMDVSSRNDGVVYGWTGVGEPGLFRTLDGGKTWEKQPADDLLRAGGAVALAVHPDAPEHVLAGTRDGLWRSIDGGASWEKAFPGVPVTALEFVPGEPGRLLAYLADGQAGLIEVEDGRVGKRLNLAFPPDQDIVLYVALDASRKGQVVAGTAWGTILKTTDGGANWSKVLENGVPVKSPG